jgi:hypothetical protein
MNVSIIGAGNVGGALVRALAKAGHAVTITSTTREKAETIAGEVGGSAAASNGDAVRAGDVVILAVYYDSIAGILDEVGDGFDGKIVVDVTNRMGQDGPGSVVDGSSNAEAIQARLPGAKVVKAFNTVFSSRQTDPRVGGIALDGYVAGSDEDARRTVLDLAGSIGLEPVDAGPLESARILEAMASLAIWRNMQGGSWQNGWKLLEP